MTQKIKWKKGYEVGNFEIDTEHKVFVEIINKIIEAVNLDLNLSYKEGLYKELIAYAKFHFISEENLMSRYKYPYLEQHKKEHEELIINMNNHFMTIDPRFVDHDKLIDFLLKWFINHTTKSDKTLSDYITHNH